MSSFIASGDWKDYLFGKAVYPPGGRLEQRTQKDYQLIVLISGSLRVTVEDIAYDLAPGDAILQHPGLREVYRFSETKTSEHTWCQVRPGIFTAHEKRLLKHAVGVRKAPASVHLLIEEGLSARSSDETYLHEAMLHLARACLLRFAAHARMLDRKDAAVPIHPALERALEIAAQHYAELRSAGDLARRVGISVTQLRVLCRQAGRESPTDMIWRLKAEHAIQMIRSTGLTLGEIADSCGYANPFHLSRAVKRYTGDSPRHLRRDEWKR
jgi:AraC-like DNA-binding protein